MIVAGFRHRHAGHCESGVTSALATHYGLPLSEPMALGLSGALTFAYIPLVKVGGFPLIAYRMPPGKVYGGLRAAIGLTMRRARFRDRARATAALDAELAAGRAVGLQASVYWLPYFPPEMRFHFNAHNLIVYGREGDEYLVSDPVFDQPQRCAVKDLETARFARGLFAPRGLMYVPERLPPGIDLAVAVRRAIGKTWKMMLHTPLPLVGVRAIRRLAGHVADFPRRLPDVRRQRLFVGNVIRMQEEIGTGGGGFRFMYAAFLQEAGERLDDAALREASTRMTAAGDQWRAFALLGAQFARQKNAVDPAALAAALEACAQHETLVYESLRRWSRGG